jgi:regulator of sigma E protease
LIAVHELGHFFAAKLCGVRVLEFAIGMGPKLMTIKQGRETLYTWRVFPIGGFCAMEGEDVSSDDPRAFTNQKAWKRVIILLAGSAMNFLFGFLLILFLAPQIFPNGLVTAEVTAAMDGSVFAVGDVIYKIDGERIHTSGDASFFLDWNGESHDVIVKRDGGLVVLRAEKNLLSEDGGSPVYGITIGGTEKGLGGVLKAVWYKCTGFVRMVRLSLVQLFTGAVGIKGMSGMVGIIDTINEQAHAAQAAEGIGAALIWIGGFGAFIAVNLAVMNLLPIPALDGGRIFFLIVTWIIERVSRRKLNPKYEGYILGVTYVLLLGLMAVVMINDVVRIIGK